MFLEPFIDKLRDNGYPLLAEFCKGSNYFEAQGSFRVDAQMHVATHAALSREVYECPYYNPGPVEFKIIHNPELKPGDVILIATDRPWGFGWE